MPDLLQASESDLRELVESARTGNDEAIGELYDRYFLRVFRFVYARTGNTHDAEDIAGEAFLKVVRAIRTFRWQESGFEAWLFRIVRNEVVNHVRKNPAHRQGVDLDAAELVEGRNDIDRSELRLMVQEATRFLPDAQREIIALRFAGGLESAQIAQALGKSESNVRVLQFKALKNLQKILAKQFAWEPSMGGVG
ncbi:MAG: sigma-70 family RNA polymerase sigma factor [Dehalococcoidia bacterium]|nr:sigma-70 family RNA polymerase sigma factor [Dehalococcoidia bacterium]